LFVKQGIKKMILNKTANGYLSISEFVGESDHFFTRLYIDYTEAQAKNLFKKDLKDFRKGLK